MRVPRRRLKKFDDAWLRWSASKLSAASACPLRAFYEIILEEPAQDIPIGALGKAIHYMFKLFLTPHPRTKRFPYGKEGAFLGIWSHFWWGAVNGRHGFGSRQEPPTAVRWENGDQPGQFYGLGVKILKQYHAEYGERRMDGVPRWAERRFVFTWHGFRISGIVDVLEIELDGAVLTDHKNRLYPAHLLETGIQMTLYQLAYERYFRAKIPGRPPLKAIRIHDYRSGKIQEAPLRPEREFGQLLSYLAYHAAYFEGVLTGRVREQLLRPTIRSLDLDDVRCGDITPTLPRGDQCTYCKYFEPCRQRELQTHRPTTRQLYLERYGQQKQLLNPTQIPLPLAHRPLVLEGIRSYIRICAENEAPVAEQQSFRFEP